MAFQHHLCGQAVAKCRNLKLGSKCTVGSQRWDNGGLDHKQRAGEFAQCGTRRMCFGQKRSQFGSNAWELVKMILLKFLAAAKDTSIRWNSRLQSGGCGLQKLHIHTWRKLNLRFLYPAENLGLGFLRPSGIIYSRHGETLCV